MAVAGRASFEHETRRLATRGRRGRVTGPAYIPHWPRPLAGLFLWGLYIWDKSHIIGGVGVATVAAPELREKKKMENLNFDNDAIVDPKDVEIAELRKQLELANRRDELKTEQLDQFGDAIMGVIGDKVEALADSVASREVERALDDFDITAYEGEIGDMLDERLPEPNDPDQDADDLKAAIREVLASANVTADIKLDLE